MEIVTNRNGKKTAQVTRHVPIPPPRCRRRKAGATDTTLVRRMTLLAVLVCLFIAAPPASAQAPTRDLMVEAQRTERRVALVIGNGAYATAPLRNPVPDARGVAQALRGLGFEVLAHENLSQKGMRRTILDFGARLRGGGVGLFYFAGHGVQVSGRNYMIPTDAAITSEAEVEVEAVDVASVLARMEIAKTRLNLVILDACRDNPFGRSFRSSAAGLASIDAPSGTLIAYATAPGKVARDGEGENGLYTGEFLKAIQVPGLKIEEVFKRVRQAVQQQTGGEQVPWEASSLVGDFVFALPGSSGVTTPPTAKTQPLLPSSGPPLTGDLDLTSEPSGATVKLDGQEKGTTPLTLERLPVGEHTLELNKDGFYASRRQVSIAANTLEKLNVSMEHLKGLGNIRVHVKTGYRGKVKVYFKEMDLWKQKGLLLAYDPISSWTLAADMKDVPSGPAEVRLEFISDRSDDVIIPLRVRSGKYFALHLELTEEGGSWLVPGKLLWRIREAYYADLVGDHLINRETALPR